MGNVIEVSGLRKAFGRTLALDRLDLAVRAGEVHGFLGPNARASLLLDCDALEYWSISPVGAYLRSPWAR